MRCVLHLPAAAPARWSKKPVGRTKAVSIGREFRPMVPEHRLAALSSYGARAAMLRDDAHDTVRCAIVA
ncbi:hypothetical protein AN416_12430 [Paraburkholderia caribensis]|nr:hypothetical protein AN416_12430 [Paraburkholderia caribensis]